MCSLLCDGGSYEAHLPHKSFICHTHFNGLPISKLWGECESVFEFTQAFASSFHSCGDDDDDPIKPNPEPSLVARGLLRRGSRLDGQSDGAGAPATPCCPVALDGFGRPQGS